MHVEHVDRWHGHVERWHREDWMGRTGRERRCSIGRSDGLIETRVGGGAGLMTVERW